MEEEDEDECSKAIVDHLRDVVLPSILKDWPPVRKNTGLLPLNKKGVIESKQWPNGLSKPLSISLKSFVPKGIEYALDGDSIEFDPPE